MLRPRQFLLYGIACVLGAPVAGGAFAQSPDTPGSSSSASRLLAEPARRPDSPFQPVEQRDIRLPVALDGFCAVSLQDGQRWIQGLSEYQLVFDRRIYWFATERHRAVFAAAPARYVPALAGNCVATLRETDRRVPGKLQFGLIHSQRLYFFASPEMQELFRADPASYAQVDVANGGHCIVSKIDDRRDIPGMPETLVIVDGIRYLFAGQQQQAQFLATMDRYGATPPAIPQPSKTSRAASSAGQALAEAKPLNAQPDSSAALPAMQGYCAVTIRRDGLWQTGNLKYQHELDGRQYLFVGPEQLALFLQDPNAFVPALGGDCPVSKVDSNQQVLGSVYHPVSYQNRLYLLAGASEKLAFKANKDAYADADLGAEGNCVVTLIETREIARGLPEFETWHHGLRYFFASQANQEEFQGSPERYLQP